MGTIYKWKKYAVNIPPTSYETIHAGGGTFPIYGDNDSVPFLVNEKDIEKIPGIWVTDPGTELENIREEVLFVTQKSAVIQEFQPDVFYPCSPNQVVFTRYKADGYCATHYGKSSTGYWKYNSKSKAVYCYAEDKTTLQEHTSAELNHLRDCTKGDLREEVISEERSTYPDNGIAPLLEDPPYGTVTYWYEYIGQEEGIPFPDSGQLEQFENAEGKPVFPLTILEGIFRMSDGKSLSSILRSIANGGSGEPGDITLVIPEGGKKGQVLVKISDKSYDTGWADPPSGGGGTTDFSNLIKLPGGGEMAVGAEFGSAPYQIEVTKDPDGEEFVTKTQMTEAVSGKISSTAVGTVVMLTEAEYTALTTKVADRMYLIKE